MKALFAHDHVFYNFNNTMYSTGGLSKEMLERYTSMFNELHIVSRQEKLSELNPKLTISSSNNIYFSAVPNFKSVKSYLKVFSARSIIEKKVLESDVVIARIPSSIGNIAIEMAKKHGKPYLVEVVACPWDALWNHSFSGKVIAPYSYFKTKSIVKESKYTIYVTEFFLQQRYPTKGKQTNCSNVSLPNVSVDVLNQRKSKINEMKTNEPIIIGTIGAVNVKYKGQQYIIEALGKLKKEGNIKFHYHLVGGGSQEYLKAIAKENDVEDQVKFLGTMPHTEIFEWLKTIDIYTQPSRQEGLPRATIEAMSQALPSFGAKTAGIPELLDSKYIFSNTSRNIQEICRIIKSFDKNTMLLQAERNFSEAKKYEKNKIEKRRKDFFEEFINS